MQQNRLHYSRSSVALLAAVVYAGLSLCSQAQTVSPPQTQSAQEAPKAQTAPAAKAAPKKSGGTPLDTIMSTKLKADVPEARDFVRESRPPADQLDYQPTKGTDPERPKLRTKAELDALQTELEGAIAQNEARTGQRKPAKSPQAAATEVAKKTKTDKPVAN